MECERIQWWKWLEVFSFKFQGRRKIFITNDPIPWSVEIGKRMMSRFLSFDDHCLDHQIFSSIDSLFQWSKHQSDFVHFIVWNRNWSRIIWSSSSMRDINLSFAQKTVLHFTFEWKRNFPKAKSMKERFSFSLLHRWRWTNCADTLTDSMKSLSLYKCTDDQLRSIYIRMTETINKSQMKEWTARNIHIDMKSDFWRVKKEFFSSVRAVQIRIISIFNHFENERIPTEKFIQGDRHFRKYLQSGDVQLEINCVVLENFESMCWFDLMFDI